MHVYIDDCTDETTSPQAKWSKYLLTPMTSTSSTSSTKCTDSNTSTLANSTTAYLILSFSIIGSFLLGGILMWMFLRTSMSTGMSMSMNKIISSSSGLYENIAMGDHSEMEDVSQP